MLCICRRAVSGVRLSSVTFVYCAETAIDTTVVAVEAFKWYHLQRHWVTPKLHFKVSTTDTGAQPLCDSWASCYCSERKQCTESDGRFVKYDAEILSPISYLQKLLGLRLICVYYPPPLRFPGYYPGVGTILHSFTLWVCLSVRLRPRVQIVSPPSESIRITSPV